MYKIHVDMYRNLIHIEMSGYVQMSEVRSYIVDLIEVITHFGKSGLLVFIDCQRLDPLSQECTCEIMKATECLKKNAKKIVAIHKRTVTQMQAKRMEAEIDKSGPDNVKIMRVRTKQEAMEYLFDRQA